MKRTLDHYWKTAETGLQIEACLDWNTRKVEYRVASDTYDWVYNRVVLRDGQHEVTFTSSQSQPDDSNIPVSLVKEIKQVNLSVLKSNLQKCVRQSNTDKAIITAYYWMMTDIEGFLRRLSIIALEDVGPFEDLDFVVWLMASYPNWKVTSNVIQTLLQWVWCLCYAPKSWREEALAVKKIYNSLDWTMVRQPFVMACWIRKSYGGMVFDRWLLQQYVSLFTEQTIMPVQLQCRKIQIIREMVPEDILLCALDHHVYPDLPKQIQSVLAVQRIRIPIESIKELIWDHSSSINQRLVAKPVSPRWETIKPEVVSIQKELHRRITKSF